MPDHECGVKQWHRDVTGARRALRSSQSREKADGYSDCSDDAGTTCSAVVNRMVLCSSVRSAVGTDRVTRSATAAGIGHSDGQCEGSVGVSGTAREPTGGPILADDIRSA